MRQTAAQKASVLLRCFLGVLFLWAATSKLANPLEFLASIYAYELPLGERFVKLVVITLPWIELLCGLLLLANVWIDTALVTSGGLLVIFVLLTGQAWLRGLNISCGCYNLSIFGLTPANSSIVRFIESVGFAFVRNLVLLGAAFFLLRTRLAQPGPAAWVGPTKPAPEVGGPVAPLSRKARKQQRRAAAAR